VPDGAGSPGRKRHAVLETPRGEREEGLRLAKEPRVSTACGRCDRSNGKWEIRGREPASVGARPQQIVSQPLRAGERYLAPVSVCSRTTLTGAANGDRRRRRLAPRPDHRPPGAVRDPARRIRATGPRPSVGPRASEARPPRACGVMAEWCSFLPREPNRYRGRLSSRSATDISFSPRGCPASATAILSIHRRVRGSRSHSRTCFA
jgi:hypothetical protein